MFVYVALTAGSEHRYLDR